jgi:hypothetical protein
MIRLNSIFVLALVLSQPAYSFSDLGHKMVAAIAWQKLTPYAKQNVERILGVGEKRFIKASVWADHIKSDERFNYLKPMHYVNMPKQALVYDRKKDCKKDKCAVEAIHTFSKVLTQGKEKDKKLALRMLIHILGDLHQPLHAGLKEDRGGNWYEVKYQDTILSLHKFWDNQLVKRMELDWQDAPSQLKLNDRSISLAKPEIWAQESHAIAMTKAYQVKENSQINEQYLVMADKVIKERISVAGWRLGMWLNKLW